MEQRTWERIWPPQLRYDYNAMNMEIALSVLEGAQQKSNAMGFAMINSVCDAAGNLTAVHRMDDAPLLSIEISQNKAKTAVLGKMPTYLWADSFKGLDPELPPLFFHSDWIVFMGGFPIIIEDKIIGAIGSSGATWEDGPIARAGLAAVGADLTLADACLEKYGIPRDKW